MPKKFFGVFLIALWVLTACIPIAGPLPDTAPTQTEESPVTTETSMPTVEVLTATPAEAPTDTPAPPTETAPAEDSAQVIGPGNADQVVETNSVEVAVANKLDWSGTGELLGVENQDGLILYVAEGLAVDARVLAGDPMSILDISADTQLMASTSDMTTVSLRNIETGEVVQEIDTGEPIYNAVFSPDGERIYVASIDVIAADAYNATTGEHLQRYTGFETAAPVYHIEISANGQQLMWISRATVQLMDIETAELGPEFGHEDWANSVRLSPDGSLLAVATAATIDGEYQPIVQLWDAASGESAGQLLTGGEDAIASALDFTPDGQLLAVGAGGSIQFWNVAEQALVSTVAAHEDRINSLAFSPSGTTLASSSSDNMLKLWQVASP